MLEDDVAVLAQDVDRFVSDRMSLERAQREEKAAYARWEELLDPEGTLDSASRPSERKAAMAILREAERAVDSQYAFVVATYESLQDAASALVSPPKRIRRKHSFWRGVD